MPRYTRTEQAKHRLSKLGYTQQELADAIGYSRPYVSSVLNGRYAPWCLEAIEEQIRFWQGAASSARS